MTSLRSVAGSIFGKTTLIITEQQSGVSAFTAKVFTADVVLSEGYSKRASITEAPVEKDSNLALNSSVNNFSINVSGITSDTTLSYFDTLESIRASPIAQALFSTATRSQKAYDQLNDWIDDGQTLKVKSKYASKGFVNKDGSNMTFLMESLSFTRNKRTGQAVSYSFTLRAVKVVTVGSADLLQLGLGVSDKGAQQLGGDTPAVTDSTTGGRSATALRDQSTEQNLKQLSNPFE